MILEKMIKNFPKNSIHICGIYFIISYYKKKSCWIQNYTTNLKFSQNHHILKLRCFIICYPHNVDIYMTPWNQLQNYIHILVWRLIWITLWTSTNQKMFANDCMSLYGHQHPLSLHLPQLHYPPQHQQQHQGKHYRSHPKH